MLRQALKTVPLLRNHCCNGKETMLSVCIVQLHVTGKNVTILSSVRKMCLWRIYVVDNNENCLGLRVKCPIFLHDFNQILSFSTDFYRRPKYQISIKSVQWESR
jgi:hypothetical protein